MSRRGSLYIRKNGGTSLSSCSNGHRGVIALGSALLAVLILALTLVPSAVSSLSGRTQKADAGWFAVFCQPFGNNMTTQADWKQSFKSYPADDQANRTFTLDEAFGNGAKFVAYYGEGQGDTFVVAAKKSDPPASTSNVKSKLEAVRTFNNCGTNTMLVDLANLGMSMSNGITGIAGFFTSSAFNPNLICSDPTKTSGCFNLVGIIGGTGSRTGGIIGLLTSSIYYPILIMVVAIAAMWIAYKGIVQRRFREAFGGALWIALSVIFGLAMLLNPSLIAKAPLSVSNSVATCVIGAFNGQNCFDNSSTNSSIDVNGVSKNVCASTAPGASLPEQMSMTTNSINCSIWRAFILNPISEGSFGTGFDNLDTTKGDLKTVLTKAKLDPNTFCVALKSTQSAKSMYGNTLNLNGGSPKVCNLMAYQMFLNVNARSGSSVKSDPKNYGYDQRWYNVIRAAAADGGMWEHWAPSTASAFNKLGISMIALLTSILGTIVLVVCALFALVYLISSVILMAFAPVFLLFGVIPGRGKRIMLGWLEKVISNVVKYIASAVFLIVALALYGGILGNLDNIALTLLFVVLVTMALLMYRHELMDLVGRVRMGGEQLSSAVTDKMRDRGVSAWKRSTQFAGATAAGAVAGMAASGENPFADVKGKGFVGGTKQVFSNVGNNLGAARSGAASSAMRDLKRGRGMVANTARQLDRENVANREALKNKFKEAELESADAQNNLETTGDNLADKKDALSQVNTQYDATGRDLDADREDYGKLQASRNDAIADMRNQMRTEAENFKNSPDASDPQAKQDFDARQSAAAEFMKMKELQGRAADLRVELQIAEAQGDTERAALIRSNIDSADRQAAAISSGMDINHRRQFEDEYSDRFQDQMEQHQIADKNPDAITSNFVNDSVDFENLSRQRGQLTQEVDEATQSVEDARNRVAGASAHSASYGQSVNNMRAGDVVTQRQVRKATRSAESSAADARAADTTPAVGPSTFEDENVRTSATPMTRQDVPRPRHLPTDKPRDSGVPTRPTGVANGPADRPRSENQAGYTPQTAQPEQAPFESSQKPSRRERREEKTQQKRDEWPQRNLTERPVGGQHGQSRIPTERPRFRGPTDADRGTTDNLNGDGLGRGNFGNGFEDFKK